MKNYKKPRTTAAISTGNIEKQQKVALIVIGNTTIDLIIARLSTNGLLKIIEIKREPADVGRDVFTDGLIKRSTIEMCIASINRFSSLIVKRGIIKHEHSRVITSSAVREAANREVFLNRIFIGCGYQIEIMEDIDRARFTYLSFHEVFKDRQSGNENILLLTMESGGTHIVHLRNHRVCSSIDFALGSLSLRKILNKKRYSSKMTGEIIDHQISSIIQRMTKSIKNVEKPHIIIYGIDARFAAEMLMPKKLGQIETAIPCAKLNSLSFRIIGMSVRELIRRYGITESDAQILGPALRLYSLVAHYFKVREVFFSDISKYHGALIEMAQHHQSVAYLRDQVILPAIEIGRRYETDERHAMHVAHLALVLFDELQLEHHLTPWHRLLLRIAALLHDIGQFVNTRSHHKHSMYLIRNSELFGLNSKDILLVALVARYHRRSVPKPTHEGYAEITRSDRLTITKLAALLRIADALDCSHKQRIDRIRFKRQPEELVILPSGINDITIEQAAIKGKGSLFEDIYGMKVRIQITD